jgi:hypothetical protein
MAGPFINLNQSEKMKYYYLISLIFLAFLIGCSSTYSVSDFSSKEKFYDDLNKSMHDKSIKVILINDSSYVINNNVRISNDSLVLLNPEESVGNNLALEKVKKISSINKGNKILTGLWVGASTGFLISLPMIAMNNRGGNHGSTQSLFPASLVYTASGGIIGVAIGSIFDRTYIYQFNP